MFEVDFNPIHPAKDRSSPVPQSVQGSGNPSSSDKSMPASMELHAPLAPEAGYLEGKTLPLQVSLSTLDLLLLVCAMGSVRDRPDYSILQFS